MSYGLPETEQCEYFTPSDCNGVDYATYIRLTDKQLMKIGLIGVTGLVCSQDRGVYLRQPNDKQPQDIESFLPESAAQQAHLSLTRQTARQCV
jgi:hypothetical protein